VVKKRERADAGATPNVAIDAGIAAPRDVAVPAASETTTLSVATDVWCKLSIDGVSFGNNDPKRRHPVEPGTHTVTCAQSADVSATQVIAVDAGRHRRVVLTLLEPVAVKVAVTRGDRVTISRSTYRNGTTVILRQRRFRVQVLRGQAVVAEEWVGIDAGYKACTLRDSPQLDCYP
jgi:hypothetical protein